jgi:hypothetical protein
MFNFEQTESRCTWYFARQKGRRTRDDGQRSPSKGPIVMNVSRRPLPFTPALPAAALFTAKTQGFLNSPRAKSKNKMAA